MDEDAVQDAWVALLEARAEGREIRNEGGWMRRVAQHAVVHRIRNRVAEREAMALYARGGYTDLYGREPRVILRGQAYKDKLAAQERARARKRRAA